MSVAASAPPVAMTDAAAIIVTKQRREAPGVEQDGIYNAAPTPYAEAPDVEDEAGKLLDNTSRNNQVDRDVEDGGARPFDSEEFEDGRVGKKTMTREGEATLVPNEPVYDGVPLELTEEPSAWYRQEKAMLFYAFAFITIIAAAVVISVLFSRLSGSPVPGNSSPSTEVAMVVPLTSAASSMTLSTMPSISFGFAPSTPPWKAAHPSNLPSSSPTNICFDTKEQLKGAVDLYIAQDCARNENCNTSHIYGYPMNSWCVGKITDMSRLFFNMKAFNEDISEWDISSVTNLRSMFSITSAFNGDISGWDVSSATNVCGMFSAASAFNSDISRWDISSVKDMKYMFRDARVFNSDISAWDFSSATDMKWMFDGASAFNINIPAWNVSSVTDMYGMFWRASAFNQDLCAWSDIYPYSAASQIFFRSGCTFQDDPNKQQGGPFCASSCSK